ncbi:hypothetical protein X777_13006 [Ooceraea biroi]|uniref:Uncharacterized protein n=1 Tax=Ooceraea biroi TaxID=2015173 RepID=A0A026VYH5_OOCBI|nr:hypothetical protein X777_13006 [Ooceraea biroi]
MSRCITDRRNAQYRAASVRICAGINRDRKFSRGCMNGGAWSAWLGRAHVERKGKKRKKREKQKEQTRTAALIADIGKINGQRAE